MSEYLIPSIEQIKALYNEVVPLLKELKTKADVIEFGKKHKVTMEINYDLADSFDESQPIEVIRCESWGDLDYIYVYTDNIAPHFDVWCGFMEHDFIDGISIDELEKSYIEGIKWLWYRSKTRPEDLKEIIGILRQHGIKYNDMIDVYGFKTEIVEEYENEHYEHGYGDILHTGAFRDEFGDIDGEPDRKVRKTIEIVDEIPKNREERFCELDTEIENWTVDEQNFALWRLLRVYADRLDIPEQCNTIEDYRKEKVNHGLWVDCNELIDMLNFELWR